MAQDKTTLFNLALSSVGSDSLISLPEEESPEAEQCRLWYPFVRDAVFRAARWSACKEAARLALLQERDDAEDWVSTDPLPGWTYAYGAPSDMICPRYISDYAPFTTKVVNEAWSIHTDKQSPILVYTKRVDEISVWDSELFMAIAYGLGSHICMPLNAKPERARLNIAKANEIIVQARVSSANEAAFQLETSPSGIQARGYSQIARERFMYPFGALLSGTAVGLD